MAVVGVLTWKFFSPPSAVGGRSQGKHRSQSVSVFTGRFTSSARPLVACNVLISWHFADELSNLILDFTAVSIEDVVVVSAREDGQDLGFF